MPALCVLVLDAQECHSLAAIRSLGRRGIRVAAASPKPSPMGFFSRYCSRRMASPSPSLEPDRFTDWLVATLRRERFDALLFFGEASANAVAQHQNAIRNLTGCLVPPLSSFLKADRKDRLARLAQGLGVPVPTTHALERVEDAATLAGRVDFPVIVKGVYGSGGHQVALVRSPERLVETVRRIAALTPDPSLPAPIVQEHIPGRGYGFTALVHDAAFVATFMHRRLSEHAVHRGTHLAHAATAAESVDEPELRRHGAALLEALGWEGMAMVEFRRCDRDGRFYLLEINPRFPGSLDLAIAAGVDFPWLYVQRAAGRRASAPPGYRIGQRFSWLVSKSLAQVVEDPLGYARNALSVLRPDTRCDIVLRDPRPHIVQLRDAAWWMREHVRGRRRAPAAPADLPQTPAAEQDAAAAGRRA